MIRALIADDEPLGRSRLRRLLADHPDVEVIGEAGDGRAARAAVLTQRPDLLFLDVQMPGEDGPAALRGLREALPHDQVPVVVFTTAHAEYALDAFELEAIDYLLKPVERSTLARALKRVRRTLGPSRPPSAAPPPPAAPESATSSTRIEARRGNRVVLLEASGVVAVIVEDTITYAVTPAGRFRVAGTLREAASRVSEDLQQVSRAAFVRPSAILELKPLQSGTFELRLRDVETVIHVSRRRARELRARLAT